MVSSTAARLRSLRSPLALTLIAASSLAYAPSARADQVVAEALFNEGQKLMEKKKYAEACLKFGDSQKEDPSPGTLLNLARCHETDGKPASAWAEYRAAAVLARTRGQADREKAAKDFADKLEPTLSKLQIDGPKDIPGLEIRRDSAVIGNSSLGLAIPIDPGEHLVEASAPGYKPWSAKITVGGSKDLQKVLIPALEKAPEAAVGTPGGPAGPGAAASDQPSAPASIGSSTQKTAGFVVGGLGVVGLVLGGVFGGLASSKASSAKSDATLCPNKVCTPAGRDAVNSASGMATISTIGFIGGGVALAAGAVLILTAGPSTPKKEATARILPDVGPNGGGLTFLGRF